MDRGRGWTVRGFPGAANDKTIINRIMLRFRPIAPKPAADGSVSDSTSAASKTPPVNLRRAKRKYVRVKKNRKCKKTDKDEENKDLLQYDGALFSLQTDAAVGGTKVSTDVGPSTDGMRFEQRQQQPVLMNFDNNVILSMGLADQLDPAVEMSPVRVVESWVVVDGMAETLPDVGGIGGTDREKMLNLEMDTCPGLISDGMYRVRWANLAYKRMVDPRGGGEPPAEVVVVLVMKEKVPVGWPMFACTVRVVYTWRKEKCTRTMACDVWKMDFGGFAWRLDSTTALCLGR